MSKMIDEIEALKKDFAFSNAILSEVISIIRKHQPEPQGVEEYQGQLRENITYALIDSANKLENVDDDNVWEITDSIMSTISPYLQTNTTELEKVREALEFIEKVAYSQYENDEKLRNRGARTLRRIGDRAKEALAIVNRILGEGK